jgi:hypothetical protein
MPQKPEDLIFSMDKEYELKNNGSKITLDVIVGVKGQSPDLKVKLGGKVLQKFKQSIKGFEIGSDNEIEGKVLKVVGNIADTADDSKQITATVKVKGGTRVLSQKFNVEVEDDGEQVDVILTIRF